MNTHYEWQRDGDLISTDPSTLNLDVIHGFLTTSYWCPGIERDTVALALRHSLCFGVYRDGGQIGFARIVTDYARFAYLLDVFILEPYRGQGLGKWLIECVLACPPVAELPSIGLATRDAHSLYEAFGWERLTSADHLIEKTRRPMTTRFRGEPEAVREVLSVERAWVEAHRHLDLVVLESIMAPDYTAIGDDGRVVGKEEDLASYSTGTRQWDIAESDEYDLRVEGDTAILIGRWRGKGMNGEVHFDYAARFTAVYVRRDGRWLMVHAQSTDIPGVTATQLERETPSI